MKTGCVSLFISDKWSDTRVSKADQVSRACALLVEMLTLEELEDICL